MTELDPTSPFREAIAITTHTIEVRIKWYRNLIISVVAVGLTSVSLTVIKYSLQPLLGLLLLFPLCGIFLYLDGLLFNKWQQKILEMWIRETLDLDIFCNAISQIRMFPRHIIKGMLKTLAINKNPKDSKNMSRDIRRSLALTLQIINHCQNRKTVLVSLAYTSVLISLAMTWILLSWLPLLGILLAPSLLGVSKWLNSLQLRRLKKHIAEIYREKGKEFKYFIEAASQLDWGSIPEKRRVQLLSI